MFLDKGSSDHTVGRFGDTEPVWEQLGKSGCDCLHDSQGDCWFLSPPWDGAHSAIRWWE